MLAPVSALLLALLLALAVAAPSLTARAELTATGGVVRATRLEGWAGEPKSPPASLLSATETSCLALVRRSLIETPGGERLVLDLRWDPGEGTRRMTLRDEATGWTAELAEQTDLRLEVTSPVDYGNARWFKAMYREEDHALSRTLAAGGLPHVTLSSTLHDRDFDAAFYRRLEAMGVAAKLVAGLPPSTLRGLRFLRSLLAGGEGRGSVVTAQDPLLLPFVEAIGRLADPASPDPYRGVAWRPAASKARLGSSIDLDDPAYAFVRRFRSLAGGGDLLAGLHAPAGGGCPTTPVPDAGAAPFVAQPQHPGR